MCFIRKRGRKPPFCFSVMFSVDGRASASATTQPRHHFRLIGRILARLLTHIATWRAGTWRSCSDRLQVGVRTTLSTVKPCSSDQFCAASATRSSCRCKQDFARVPSHLHPDSFATKVTNVLWVNWKNPRTTREGAVATTSCASQRNIPGKLANSLQAISPILSYLNQVVVAAQILLDSARATS